LRHVISFYLSYSASIIISQIIGIIITFILNKIFIFAKGRQKLSISVLFFVLVNIESLLQTLLLSNVFLWLFKKLNIDFYNPITAHFIGVGSTSITSYIGHKLLSFKDYKND
jgi:putative flippase GtrA